MEIEYDPAKDEANRRRRGLPFDLAIEVLRNTVVVFEDDRRDYRERRMIAFGAIAGRLHVCVYTMRGEVYRVISLRRANGKEVGRWQPSA